ncbi:MAG: exosortase family protein XrtF [Bergeyella sp.]|nr:exosortase family protein XrtF [Bergeyella sp.]
MLKGLKPILVPFSRFLTTYLALVFLYQIYLNAYKENGLDPLSRKIAWCTSEIINTTNHYTSQLVDQKEYEGVWFFINGKYTTRMVEGCNAVSIIILFIAFIFAFYKGYTTFIFVGIGIILIYLINIARIVALNLIARSLPAYSKIAHDYFFPAIIYGTVVILWIIWIHYFASTK